MLPRRSKGGDPTAANTANDPPIWLRVDGDTCFLFHKWQYFLKKKIAVVWSQTVIFETSLGFAVSVGLNRSFFNGFVRHTRIYEDGNRWFYLSFADHVIEYICCSNWSAPRQIEGSVVKENDARLATGLFWDVDVQQATGPSENRSR